MYGFRLIQKETKAMTNPDKPLRVVLADDHPIVRAGIRAELEAAGMIVAGEATDGAQALQLTEALHPDVLVLDVEMPVINGLDVCRRLQEAGAPVHVLVLSAYDHAAYVYGLLEAGAHGYLLKDEAPDTIVQAVIATATGALWLSPSIAGRVRQRVLGQEAADVTSLTQRETELLRHIVAGSTNAEIAEALQVREQTIKNYVSRLYAKLGVHSRVEAVTWATQHEWLL
jgi:DNA-binding NarL/FixJ family response regulator